MTPVCPICREMTTGEADLMPSGALVARKACESCLASPSSNTVQVDTRPRDGGTAGRTGRNRYVKCSGPCQRVLLGSKMNRISSRGKKAREVCGDCLTKSIMASVMN